jgi:hypothetical protein
MVWNVHSLLTIVSHRVEIKSDEIGQQEIILGGIPRAISDVESVGIVSTAPSGRCGWVCHGGSTVLRRGRASMGMRIVDCSLGT